MKVLPEIKLRDKLCNFAKEILLRSTNGQQISLRMVEVLERESEKGSNILFELSNIKLGSYFRFDSGG